MPKSKPRNVFVEFFTFLGIWLIKYGHSTQFKTKLGLMYQFALNLDIFAFSFWEERYFKLTPKNLICWMQPSPNFFTF